VAGDGVRRRSDRLATEEPLEIRLVAGADRRTLAVTMRTPGNDFELAAGFLLCEGVVKRAAELRRMSYCVDRGLDERQQFNVVNVELATAELPELPSLDRHFLTSSACGVCGKATLDFLHDSGWRAPDSTVEITPEVLVGLPEKLIDAQGLFASTGGLHAAALFDRDGDLVALREDVGRHNALDKLIGWAMTAGRLPLSSHVVMVSGRASFEILQKCLAAGAPIVCAVSAPSSLAVDVARNFGMTLVGFLRRDRFNVYSGPHRVRVGEPSRLGDKWAAPGSTESVTVEGVERAPRASEAAAGRPE
jgi:FdhD protein